MSTVRPPGLAHVHLERRELAIGQPEELEVERPLAYAEGTHDVPAESVEVGCDLAVDPVEHVRPAHRVEHGEPVNERGREDDLARAIDQPVEAEELALEVLLQDV